MLDNYIKEKHKKQYEYCYEVLIAKLSDISKICSKNMSIGIVNPLLELIKINNQEVWKGRGKSKMSDHNL